LSSLSGNPTPLVNLSERLPSTTMLLIARKWRSRKTVLYLFAAEFPFTVAALALFAIAQPNTYRTRLWADGYTNGFNSSPTEILYSYANHRPIGPPIIWSQL
jgi:hypothetical protein